MYGSRVYGTQSDQSDHDFIMVSDMEEPFVQFHSGDLNCTAFSVAEFEKRLAEYEITILECVFLPENMILKNFVPYPNHITNVDLYALRRSVSAKASNSYVKAKKKFIVEADRDIYVGKKKPFSCSSHSNVRRANRKAR